MKYRHQGRGRKRFFACHSEGADCNGLMPEKIIPMKWIETTATEESSGSRL